jgi:hypothetical protein
MVGFFKGQWAVVSSQWAVVSSQWAVVNGQWLVVSGQSGSDGKNRTDPASSNIGHSPFTIHHHYFGA